MVAMYISVVGVLVCKKFSSSKFQMRCRDSFVLFFHRNDWEVKIAKSLTN